MSTQLDALEKRIQEQTEKLNQLRAQKQKAQNRLRAKEREQKRKDDTRRKILIGACMMKLAEDNPDANDRMLRQLDRFLTEERDRKLFQLD
ncbi:mobilization protein [Wohlfahrtiimonas chitiniclastica]|uniref:mobilization protein n=1 Tax=Wohlfahrtiimonas chitiniclastica TaxID=400946 RepID=UPI000B98C20D|nr:mobilization protein [Wohlfahrtiimonas chitiniclastica]OYQ77518.1 mobilization protein [Wohlfahrtiimonas chitiniclastica]